MVYGLIIVRWVHWAACLLLGSSQLFRVWLLPVCEPSERGKAQLGVQGLEMRLGTMAIVTWAVALFSMMLWFGLTAWDMTGADAGSFDLSFLDAVAGQTQFGRVCLMRLAILAVLGVCLFAAHGKPVLAATARHRVTTAALTLVNLVMLALTSHAAAAPGMTGTWRLLVDAVHLLAASIWPGGLVWFALLLRCALQSKPLPLLGIAARATHRFSALSLMAVGVLSGTGLVMRFFFLNQVHDLWTSAYGRLLTTKVIIFSGMLAIGAWNLLILRRKLGSQAQQPCGDEPAAPACALFRNVMCEIVLSAIVLLVVAALGLTGPPVRAG